MNVPKVDPKNIVPIISDGAIGTPEYGDGRLIPVLVIDCEKHQALRDCIYQHEGSPPGDVTVKWARSRFISKYVYLAMSFTRPTEANATFKFDIDRQGGLVDGLISSRGVYLQPKESGVRVSHGLDNPKILVEIPASANLPGWEKVYELRLLRIFNKRGLSRKEAKIAVDQHKTRLREIWRRRMPSQ